MDLAEFHDLPPLELAFGRTPAMRAIRQKLESIAETGVPVLLQGESGTGKEVCARFLHLFSGPHERLAGKGELPCDPGEPDGNRALRL